MDPSQDNKQHFTIKTGSNYKDNDNARPSKCKVLHLFYIHWAGSYKIALQPAFLGSIWQDLVKKE